MENLYDYKKYAILYVDDEEKSLKYFERAFGDEFRVMTASNAPDGLKLLERHADDIGLLLTDQRMPGEKGVWLLERARQLRPRILRVLVTAYSDFDAAIAAVNSGAIYKYVIKPWDPPQFELTLRHGMEYFMVQAERDQLLHEKMSVLRNMMIADRIVSLGLLAAGLSHQIRNSLVAVKTFLDLAPKKMAEERASANGLRNPDFWKDYHQNVQSQIEKINDLLKDLCTASDNAAPIEEEVSLRQIVDEALAGMRDQFGARRIEVECVLADTLPTLKADKRKIRTLFELLLKEELATLPAGSRVSMSAEPADGGPKPAIAVKIADNGPGLPEEALRVIFDPFVVRDNVPSEYGVNLMACFFIVHHHGGKIDAKSQAGRGTTFTLRLPLQPERDETPPDEMDFLQRTLLNNEIWQKLISSG